MIRAEIEKGSMQLGEMFPPIFSPDRQRTHQSFLTEQNRGTDSSSPTTRTRQGEGSPLVMHNNNLLEGGFKRLGKIIARSGSDDKHIVLNRENLLKKKVSPEDDDSPVSYTHLTLPTKA